MAMAEGGVERQESVSPRAAAFVYYFLATVFDCTRGVRQRTRWGLPRLGACQYSAFARAHVSDQSSQCVLCRSVLLSACGSLECASHAIAALARPS